MQNEARNTVTLSKPMKLENDDLEELKLAKSSIRNLGVVMTNLNKVGDKIESGIKTLPENQQKWLAKNITNILFKILKSNISAIDHNKVFTNSSNSKYKLLVSASGIGSGLFGSFNLIGASIFVSELYFSTRVMLLNIIEIASSEGEDISEYDTQLACIQVFALGGNPDEENSAETAYYSTRFAMVAAVRGASTYMAKYGVKGLGKIMMTNANPVLMMIGLIATRLSIQISEKFISRAVPIFGAIGGGALNFVYIDHFQKMAKSHFTIRRLERKYGQVMVKAAYDQIDV